MFIKCGETWVRYDAIVSYGPVFNGVDVVDTNGVHHVYAGKLAEFQSLLTNEQGEV